MGSSASPAEAGPVDVDRALMAAPARDGRAGYTELAGVSTRTTVVLSTVVEDRPPL